MPGPPETADMPHRSFLLTPLEATDPTVDCSSLADESSSPSIFSPTPRKSLFEMSSKDLRAVERAWLQKVESFKAPSMSENHSIKIMLDGLPAQQQGARRSSRTDADVEEGSAPARQSSRSTGDLLQGLGNLGLTEGAGTIKACRDPRYAAYNAPEDSPPLITAADESSISDEGPSLSLRQRYTNHATGLTAGSIELVTVAKSNTDSTQDLGPCKVLDSAAASSKGRSTQDLKPCRTLDGAGVQGAAELSSLQQLGTHSVPQEGNTQGAADVSPDLKDAEQEAHMPRTPWIGRLKPIRRPSAGWRTTPRESSQEPPEAVTGSAGEAAPSEQTGYRHSSASTGKPGQAALSDVLEQQRSSGSAEHSTSAQQSLALEKHNSPACSVDLQDAADEAWQSQADSDSREGSAAPESTGTGQAQLGLTSPPGFLEGPPDSPNSFALGRHWVPEADLGDFLSLESACPSAVGERLTHPAYHGSVHNTHAPGGTAPSRGSAQQKRLLRGATPEECGVKMYERALAAQQRRQARAEAMRRELEAAASADCTFTPRLNTERTNKLLWKSLSGPSTVPLPEERRMLQEEAPAVSPGGIPAPRKDKTVQKMDLSEEQNTARSIRGINAGQRLYASALTALQRQRTFTSQYIQGELESLRAASPRARSLPKHIYGAAAQSRIDLIRSQVISPRRRKPAYEDTVKECTFQPVTTWRSISAALAAAKGLPETDAPSPEDALSRLLQGTSTPSLDMGHLPVRDCNPEPASGHAKRSHAARDAGQLKSKVKIGALKLQRLACSQSDKSATHSGLTGEPSQLRQNGQPESVPARTRTWQLSESLDFSEFLDRQRSHLEMHACQVESSRAQINNEAQARLGMSPGSRALLKRCASVPVHKKQAGYQKPEPLVRPRNAAEHRFRPRITAKARLRRAHTIDELYEGGRARRHYALEVLRAESLRAEESQLTFRPSINRHYQTSGPRLKLSNPGPYLAHIQARAARHKESLLHSKLAAEEEALKDCTYSPRTTELPLFIERLAREYAADVQERPVEDDGFVSPGSGDEGFGHLFTILQPEWR